MGQEAPGRVVGAVPVTRLAYDPAATGMPAWDEPGGDAYEEAFDMPTGYSPALALLAGMTLRELAAVFRAQFPGLPLPRRVRTGELHRDLFMAALLEAGDSR